MSVEAKEGLPIERDVRLGRFTTLGVGGRASYLCRPNDVPTLQKSLSWAQGQGLQVWVLGGGSNAVISDHGLDGMVVQYRGSQREILRRDKDHMWIRVEAGHDWDQWVEWTVEEGWAGVECMSGIPGWVGAAPIQNIGAYGQELCETFVEASVLDLHSGAIERWDSARCEFGYRDSALKRAEPGRYLVLDVTLRLRCDGVAAVRYPELVRAIEAEPSEDSSEAVLSVRRIRQTVLALRRRKSMVVAEDDPNTRSAGSFFTNPIIPEERATEVKVRLAGRLREGEDMPCFPAGTGLVKLSAAWLIERCGLTRGCGVGRVGLSQKHTLAIVNRGGATASEILGFAHLIQQHVFAVCGVHLEPEPVFLGFPQRDLSAFAGPTFEDVKHTMF